ncbi:MAG: diacylglycerol kinase family lipid kinase [Eubacteriales bacterium]|nr:diacylglycerol kinase family lipid kinase [Eubacteriales bacterium]
MKHLFVVNPTAGKGKAEKYVERIGKEAGGLLEEYEIKITEYPGHATEIVKEHVSKEKYRIYSVGGDGTLNEVTNGMAGSDSELAVIPAGSGNDFIRSVTSDDPKKNIISRTIRGKAAPVDLVKVNDRYFINISSMGLDAEVAYFANKLKETKFVPGFLSYYLGLICTLVKCRSHHLKLIIDDQEVEEDALLVAVANGRYYGKGILPAPQAHFDDGLLDICLIEKKGRLEIIRLFPKYVKGKHADIPGVRFFTCKNVKISTSSSIAINLDGEVSRINEASYEIIPHGILVVYPEPTVLLHS